MMVRRAIRLRRERAIHNYVLRGLDSAEIAPLVGLSGRDAVNRVRREIGCPARNCTTFSRWRPDERSAWMSRLWFQGLSVTEIAEEIGVLPETVRRWQKLLQFDPQRRQRLLPSQLEILGAIGDGQRDHGSLRFVGPCSARTAQTPPKAGVGEA